MILMRKGVIFFFTLGLKYNNKIGKIEIKLAYSFIFINNSSGLGIKHFIVNSENLGIRFWQKKCVSYDKFEIAARRCELNI